MEKLPQIVPRPHHPIDVKQNHPIADWHKSTRVGILEPSVIGRYISSKQQGRRGRLLRYACPAVLFNNCAICAIANDTSSQKE
ncbi:hypothetical protein QUA82_03565 [Microcoleus sp. F8-D3]